MKFLLLGQSWKITVITPEAFVRRFNEEFSGITIGSCREIIINKDDMTQDTLRHELWHAALECLCVSTASLKKSQLEEVSCELFALHGIKLIKLSKDLYKALQ